MKGRGRLVGSGRGSSSGCLTSYLLRITEVDPIPYGLSFERFFNEGRCQPGRAKIPDVDTDFQRAYRDEVYDYLKGMYGVAQYGKIATFGTLKGKAALKEVLRVNNVCDPQTMNDITLAIQDEAKISDELQIMKDAGLEPSIIMWSLENKSKELHKYCYLGDDGSLQGEYSKQFEQAIRLEGCRRDISRHPSAVVIANEPIANLVPMIFDKTSDDPMCGYDMHGCEDIGLVKLDILSLGTLDKLTLCGDNLYD
jgi:DNA polymerase-3 subunit alpha